MYSKRTINPNNRSNNIFQNNNQKLTFISSEELFVNSYGENQIEAIMIFNFYSLNKIIIINLIMMAVILFLKGNLRVSRIKYNF